MTKLNLLRFSTIDLEELEAVRDAMHFPLSGFLGGEPRGGEYVRALEQAWCDEFGCTHAIAVNSATSGLLAACAAIGVKHEGVLVSPYTMSATAAAPAFLGGYLKFIDVEPEHYCIDPVKVSKQIALTPGPKAIIATNLFGHPAQLKLLAQLAHANGAFLIEDNAQAPFAREDGSYAGTIGDLGVFSLNVHKHMQCGEGGVVVTDNDDFAADIRGFINHGEMAGGPLGLNLRMTEVTAAIAMAQLARGQEIVQSRVDLAEALIEGLKDNPLIKINPPRAGCRHVYYVLPMEVRENVDRTAILKMLDNEGVPLCAGYVPPLYWMPAFKPYAVGECPVTERLHKSDLAYFEICAYDPDKDQIRQIIDAFDKVADHAHKWT